MEKFLRRLVLTNAVIAFLLVWQVESFADAWFGPPKIDFRVEDGDFGWDTYNNTHFITELAETLTDKPGTYTCRLQISSTAKKDRYATGKNDNENKCSAEINLPIHVDSSSSRVVVTLDVDLHQITQITGGRFLVEGTLLDTENNGIFKKNGEKYKTFYSIVGESGYENNDNLSAAQIFSEQPHVKSSVPLIRYMSRPIDIQSAGTVTASIRVRSYAETNAGYADSADVKCAGWVTFVAKITEKPTVNDLVTFEPIKLSYQTTSDTSDCGDGFGGQFSFDAKIQNNETSHTILSNLVVRVKKLTNGNLLHNTGPCGDNGGEGSEMTIPLPPPQTGDDYADGDLRPGQHTNVHFIICLKDKTPFTFRVDMLGVTDIDETAQEAMSLDSQDHESVTTPKSRITDRRGFFGRFRP